MNTTIGQQAHKVNIHAISLGILKRSYNLLVLQNRTTLTSAVNLHEVLIYDTTCADIEVTYLRVTHLTLRQTYILAIGTQLGVRIGSRQRVDKLGICRTNCIGLGMISNTPTVQNH